MRSLLLNTSHTGGLSVVSCSLNIARMAYVPPHLRRKAAAEGTAPQKPRHLSDLEDDGGRTNSRRPERGYYRSAYEDKRESAANFASGANDEDPSAQYAKLVEFSRYRREHLGLTRDHQTNGSTRRRQSAPRAFGTNDHGRGLEPKEDVEGGERVDADGMVYRLADGKCVYFCDRFRRYKFYCGRNGLELLEKLVSVNDKMLEENAKTFSKDPSKAAQERAEGYALYEEKPNLRRKTDDVGTWSDREYSLPGFQYFYLKLKSFQRFAETWALLERCDAAGVLVPDEVGAVVSLGGGPGYELLAYHQYLLKNSRGPHLPKFASFDRQPSWAPYVELLGYDFKQWDVHSPEALEAILQVECAHHTKVVCLLSNILCYCSDDATADLFARLLDDKVAAIFANERGAVQRMCDLVEDRGVVVVRLLDQQNAGRDDRQLVFLKPGSRPDLSGIPLGIETPRVFPNQPYEEKKGVRRTAD